MLISWLYSVSAMSVFVGIPLGSGGQVAMLWAFTHHLPMGTSNTHGANRSVAIPPGSARLANRNPMGQRWSPWALDTPWALESLDRLVGALRLLESYWPNVPATAFVGQQDQGNSRDTNRLLASNWVNSQHPGVIGLGWWGSGVNFRVPMVPVLGVAPFSHTYNFQTFHPCWYN